MKFERTICACDRCKHCCKVQPGPLAPGDLERIAEYLGEDIETAKKKFVASPGALIADVIDRSIKRVGSITPKAKKGRCIFLNDQDQCMIHKVAPFGCAYFDTHMSNAVADPRSIWLIKQQMTREYQRLRSTLQLSERYAKELRERQDK